MAEKNSFVLYHKYDEILQDLSDEQFGKLMRALFAHSMGEEPEDLTPEIAMAYRFIANQIDIDRDKYDKKCEGRKVSGAVGGKKRAENAKSCENPKQPQANEANATFACNSKQGQANQAIATFASNFKQTKQPQANQADNDYDNDYDHENENDNVYVTDYDNDKEQSAQSALPVEKSVEKSVSRESIDFSVSDGQKTSIGVIANMPTFETVEKYCAENHPNLNAQDFYDYYKAQGWCCNGKPIKSWKSLLSSWAKHQREKPQEQSASYDVDEFVRLAMSRSFEDV